MILSTGAEGQRNGACGGPQTGETVRKGPGRNVGGYHTPALYRRMVACRRPACPYTFFLNRDRANRWPGQCAAKLTAQPEGFSLCPCFAGAKASNFERATPIHKIAAPVPTTARSVAKPSKIHLDPKSVQPTAFGLFSELLGHSSTDVSGIGGPWAGTSKPREPNMAPLQHIPVTIRGGPKN